MAFATASDVATRLGRDLTAAEQSQATAVIEIVDGLIRDAVDQDADWTPSPVPAAVKEMCVQKAIGAIANPQNVAAFSEQLGAHSYSATFQRQQDGGIFLSDAEGRALRLAVWGTNAGSSSPRGLSDRVIDLRENRDVDELPAE